MVPLMAAPLCVMVRNARLSWCIALLANGTAAVVAFLLLQQVLEHGVIRYAIGGWAAPTGIEYYIDTLNAAVYLCLPQCRQINTD